MTRKHFIEFANEIRQLVSEGKVEEARLVANVVTTVCKRFNPAFSYGRFIAHCGLQEREMVHHAD